MDWPLLASLPEEDRRDFLALGRPRAFARDETICHAGDPADALHLVTEGRLAVRVSLASGDSAMINVLGPGDYFGELALLRSDGHRTASVAALEPSRTVAITYSAFRRLCETRPAVEQALTTLMADRIDQLSQRLLETTFLSLDRRVCRRLLDLCIGRGSDGPMTIMLTQSQLGELTGGTRPSVNQALQRLVDQGIIALGRGRIDVLDVPRLRSKAGL